MKPLKPLKRRGYLHDPQVLAVYRWERQWRCFNEPTASLSRCRKLIRHACELYGVPPPVVTNLEDGEKPAFKYSYYAEDPHKILLQFQHHNNSVALHEAAHAIVWYKFRDQRIDHGPTWLGVYLWLLVADQIAPRSALEASMKEHELEWTSLEESSPRNLGRNKSLARV